MILDKLKQKQVFSNQNDLFNRPIGQVLEQFEHNVLTILRDFEQKL